MPYFTPPGGDLTAAYARSLLGILHSQPRYQRFAIPAPVVMSRAAQMARAGQQLVMSGMGLGILPTVNVRYVKTAIPAALASRRFRELHPDEQLHGLGKAAGGRVIIAGGRPVDVFGRGGVSLAPIKRQAGFFMGPGGGPGGGPFQFPGFTVPTMRGLGQNEPSSYDPSTGIVDTTPPLLPPQTDIPFFSAPPVPVDQSTYDTNAPLVTPAAANAAAAIAKQTSIPFFQPGRPTRLLPMTAAPVGAPIPSAPTAGVQRFFSSSTMGVPNVVLAIGGGALLLLLSRGKRRRNPSSSRARKYGRRARSSRRRR